MAKKQFKAIKKGFDGKKIRMAGEVFEYEGKPGKWMKEVGAAESKEAVKSMKAKSKDKPKDEDVI